jgi:hypothetical protein
MKTTCFFLLRTQSSVVRRAITPSIRNQFYTLQSELGVRGGEAALVCEAVGTLAAAVAEQGASFGAAAIANGDPTGALAVAAAGDDSEIVFNGFLNLPLNELKGRYFHIERFFQEKLK